MKTGSLLEGGGVRSEGFTLSFTVPDADSGGFESSF
jgi:hypothetical protein